MNSPAPVIQTPATVGAAPWWTSPVQVSQVVAAISLITLLFPKVTAELGLTSPAAIDSLANQIATVIGSVASLAALGLRAYSKIQPLVLTEKRAAEHPATVVAIANGSAAPPAIKATQDTAK